MIRMAPTLNTAVLLVFRPRWALYRAWDLEMLHFTTVLGWMKNNQNKTSG